MPPCHPPVWAGAERWPGPHRLLDLYPAGSRRQDRRRCRSAAALSAACGTRRSAGLDLGPADCWLLLRLGEHTPLAATDLPGSIQLADSVLGPHLDRLAERGDMTRRDGMLELTDAGRAVVQRLIDGRSERLAALPKGYIHCGG